AAGAGSAAAAVACASGSRAASSPAAATGASGPSCASDAAASGSQAAAATGASAAASAHPPGTSTRGTPATPGRADASARAYYGTCPEAFSRATAGCRDAHRGSGGGATPGPRARSSPAADYGGPPVLPPGQRDDLLRLDHPNGPLHQPLSRRRLRARHHRREPHARAAGVFAAQALGLARVPRLDAELLPLPHGAWHSRAAGHPVSL